MKTYSYGEWMNDLAGMIGKAADEMERICKEKSYTLKGHLESYSLLETLWLLDNFKEHTGLVEDNVTEEEYSQLKSQLASAIALYDKTFDSCKDTLVSLYNQEALEAAAADYMQPWKEKVERAENRLGKMKQLHAVAAEASEIFQKGSLFKKFLILRKLRAEAGFRLKRNRVCNFAAKTFDLVNEAQNELNQAQNGLHSSNVTYKCIADLYPRIARELAAITASILQ